MPRLRLKLNGLNSKKNEQNQDVSETFNEMSACNSVILKSPLKCYNVNAKTRRDSRE